MVHPDEVVESQLAVLSMGCFWKAEADLGGLPGVYATDVGECPVVHGYVCACVLTAAAGYVAGVEAVRCRFNPAVTPFSQILEVFEQSLLTPVGKNEKYASCVYPRCAPTTGTPADCCRCYRDEAQQADAEERLGRDHIRQFRGFRRAPPDHQKCATLALSVSPYECSVVWVQLCGFSCVGSVVWAQLCGLSCVGSAVWVQVLSESLQIRQAV